MDWLLSGELDASGRTVLWALVVACAVLLTQVSRHRLRRSRLVSPPEVQERLDRGLEMMVLDVRSREAFADGHVADAVNIPAAEFRGALDDAVHGLPADHDSMLVVIGETRSAAERCAERLRRAGYTRVGVVDGGMRGWIADRLPVYDGSGMAAAEGHR